MNMKKKNALKFPIIHSLLCFASTSSAYNTTEWRAISQILDQVFHTTKVATKKLLFLCGGQSCNPVAVGTLASVSSIDVECARKLRRTALEHRLSLVSAGGRRGLGHQIEVEEFDEL